MSKLVKKLKQISEGAAQPLGFKIATVSPNRRMLLIAALPRGDATKVAQLTKAEVDAILIYSQDLERNKQIPQQLAKSAGSIPWGIWLKAMTEEKVKKLTEIGSDFLIFEASTAPAIILWQEEVGKVLKMDLPQDNGLLMTIDRLPIDVVLLEIKKEGEVLTISDLMHCQWLAGLIDKPLLVATAQELTDKETRALWEVGVNGIVMEVGEEQLQERLKRLCQAIEALPTTPKRRREGRAVLPRLAPEPKEMSEEI